MKRTYLGELEEVVLLTVAALQESAYCASITQTIDQQMGGATTERGGRQKRLFTVLTAGQRATIECRRANVRQVRAQLWDGPAIRQISTQVLQLWGA
jgi:PadR family transcriptional regulator PadR